MTGFDDTLRALRPMFGVGGYDLEEGAKAGEVQSAAVVYGQIADDVAALLLEVVPYADLELLLSEWEISLGLSNDAARTVEQRARRVRLARRVRAVSLSALQTLLAEDFGVVGSDFDLGVEKASVQAYVVAGCASHNVFRSWFWLRDSRYLNAHYYRLAATILRRMLPAAAWGDHFRTSVRYNLGASKSLNPKWNDGTAVIGRAMLARGGVYLNQRPPSRVRDYGTRSLLVADDLNTIRRFGRMGPAVGADCDAVGTASGARTLFFAIEVPNGTTRTIEAIDMTDRMVRTSLVYAGGDIRPGAPNDGFLNNSSAHFTGIAYSRDGASTSYDLTITTNLTMRLRAAGLQINNATGGAQYVVGFVEITGTLTSGFSGYASPTYSYTDEVADGDTLASAGIDGSFASQLAESGALRRATHADVDQWSSGYAAAGYGGSSRFVCVHRNVRPAASPEWFVLDTTMDWRDRVLMVEPALRPGLPSEYVGYPGTDFDYQIGGDWQLIGYTGSGINVASAAFPQAFEIVVKSASGTTYRSLAVDSATGHLIMRSPVGVGLVSPLMLMIHATDQTGERTTVTGPISYPSAEFADGLPLYPHHLNILQDWMITTQLRGGELGMPLGPILGNDGLTPIVWTKRTREGGLLGVGVGASGLITNLDREELRQPAAGRLRRWFAFDVANGASVEVDDSEDWRDRFASVVCAQATTDIRPGNVDDASIDASANLRLGAGYTGPGRVDGSGTDYTVNIGTSGNLVLYASTTDGSLRAYNASGSTRYVVGFIEASFPLGPRSATT